ncbi:MAG: hypothetical protein WDW36_003912 [Sanguina aurantia]
MPTTFALPREALQFAEAFQRASHGVEPSVTQPKGRNLWILKPVGLSRGRGIRIVSSLAEVEESAEEPVVLQRYITSPLLMDGFKFDLRLYVLVTSFNPLEAWLHCEGFARFATLPFSLDQVSDRFVHLTNASVQKERADIGCLPDFLKHAVPHGGSKCSLAVLRSMLESRGPCDWKSVWTSMTEAILGALFAAQDAVPHSVNSFELFGFDLLLDSSMQAWLIEVNSLPSLSLDTPLDREIKAVVVRDVIRLVDPLPFDRAALLDVLQTRTCGRGRLGRRNGGVMSGTVTAEREVMCGDMLAVLQGGMPRRYGQMPSSTGGFERIAPSPMYDKLLKLKRPL